MEDKENCIPCATQRKVLVEMLRNIKTNSEIIIDMLEEMQYDSVSFNTEGVRNDK